MYNTLYNKIENQKRCELAISGFHAIGGILFFLALDSDLLCRWGLHSVMWCTIFSCSASEDFFPSLYSVGKCFYVVPQRIFLFLSMGCCAMFSCGAPTEFSVPQYKLFWCATSEEADLPHEPDLPALGHPHRCRRHFLLCSQWSGKSTWSSSFHFFLFFRFLADLFSVWQLSSRSLPCSTLFVASPHRCLLYVGFIWGLKVSWRFPTWKQLTYGCWLVSSLSSPALQNTELFFTSPAGPHSLYQIHRQVVQDSTKCTHDQISHHLNSIQGRLATQGGRIDPGRGREKQAARGVEPATCLPSSWETGCQCSWSVCCQASFVWQEKRQKLVRGVAVLPPALGQPVALEKAKKDVGGVKAK